MNEGSGKRCIDATNNLVFSLTNGAIYTTIVNPGIYCNGTNLRGGYLSPIPPYLKIPQTVSIIWYGMVTGNGTLAGSPALFSVVPNSTDAAPYASYSIVRNNTTASTINFSWNNGTVQTLTATNTTFNNIPVIIACTHGMGWVKIYKNGILQNSTNSNVGTISYASTATLLVGRHVVTVTNNSQSISFLGLIYNRVLTPFNIRSLCENPYQFIREPTYRFYSTPPAGAVSYQCATIIES
jgi:hypothetical protein